MCGMDDVVRTVMAGCDEGREALLDGLLVLLALRVCLSAWLLLRSSFLVRASPLVRLPPASARWERQDRTRRTNARSLARTPRLGHGLSPGEARQDHAIDCW